MLFVCLPKFCISIVLSFSWGFFNSQEKLKTMLMQNFGVTNKEHYGMLWYFLEWSIVTGLFCNRAQVPSPQFPSPWSAGESLVNLTSFSLFYEQHANKLTIDCHCYSTFKEALQNKYILLDVYRLKRSYLG